MWSDTQGQIHVIDGYCRHMGGDLTMGEVKGDEIACPFHDWRWGGDGKCKSIPYARRVPLHRRWYSQFYTDVADIDPEATARYEFEVDTSHANEHWRGEVADNIARREQAVDA